MDEAHTESAAPSGPARLVWVVLLALLLARGATALVPSMWAWGINVQRFLPAPSAWLPWVVALLLLHPGIARPVGCRLEGLGNSLVGGRLAIILGALAAAALVWALPDRTWVTGDFLLRQGTAESGAFPTNFVQSMPLEVVLHQWIPRLSGTVSVVDPNVVNRAIGALAAAGLAVAGVALAREWGFTGSAAVVAAGMVFFGGYLTAFTGLGKPAAVVCLLTALALLGATRFVRTGRGGVLLGVAMGLALLTHRAALALLPMWLAALVLSRRSGTPKAGHVRGRLVAVGLPAVCAVSAAPIVAGIIRRHDLPHHIAPSGRGLGDLLGAALAPLHLVDLANVVLFYCPLVVAAAVLGARLRALPRAERALAPILAISFVPVLLFVHPMQGIFRDLDVFVPAGVACALLGAQVVGGALARRQLPAWLAPALLAAVVVPAVQWLLHFHDPGQGLRRVRSYALEAPARSPEELARLWDVIAYRAIRLNDWPTAAEATAESARLAPHPRALIMLAIARTYTGEHRAAEKVYIDLARRSPEDPLVWVGLGGAALRVGDSLEARRAIAKLEQYAPQSREARIVRQHLRMFPLVWPRSDETPSATPP